MSNKMICPVCGKTELIRMFNPLTGKYFEDYDCPFRLCNFRGNKAAVDALIQAKQDLEFFKEEQDRSATALIERTKELDKCQKDLEKANAELDYIKEQVEKRQALYNARNALEQINRKQD